MNSLRTNSSFVSCVVDQALSSSAGPVLTALVCSGADPWIVGGYIRDTYLGTTPPRDLDVMVANSHWPMAIAALDRFDTAVLPYDCHRLGDSNWQIDVFSPAKFFEGFSSIPAALSRFDFSANAIAINVRSREMLDPTGGIADLTDGLLSPLSGAWVDAALNSEQALTLESRLVRLLASTKLTLTEDGWTVVEQFRNRRRAAGAGASKVGTP